MFGEESYVSSGLGFSECSSLTVLQYHCVSQACEVRFWKKAWHERLLANEKTSSTTISLAGNTEMDAEELAQYGEALIDALTHTSSQLDIFKEDNSNKDDLAMCRTLCEEALSAWRSLCDDARPERWLQLQQDLELALFD